MRSRPIYPAPQSDGHALIARSPIAPHDAPLFNLAFSRALCPISDMTFATSLGWADPLELSYALVEGHLCLFSGADGDLTMMLPPLALSPTFDDRLGPCVERCFDHMDAHNNDPARSRIEYVSDELLERLRAPGVPALSASPMPGDYVYPRDAMVELAGGPLKNKRKLRSKFIRENPDITVAPITDADVPECAALLTLWRRAADQRHEGEANERLIGTDVLRKRDEAFTTTLLNQRDALGLETMLVRSAGTLVAFTIGERLTADQGVVYVEKTDPDADGAPQFIFSTFCERHFQGVSEINVGDDWGIESLRYTKSSYRPTRMIAKSMLSRAPTPRILGVEHDIMRSLRRVPLDPNAPPIPESAGITLRAATKHDADDIVEIEASAFIEDDRFSARQVKRLIENPRAIVIVAAKDDAVLGWSVALVRTHRRWRSGRIYGVAVAHSAKGQGIGRALVETLIDKLEAQSITRIYLEVRADNTPAMTLYESLGFEPIAILADYYADDIHGLRMRRITEEPQPA